MKGLTRVPRRVRDKALEVEAMIDSGAAVHEFGGRRMRHNRTIIGVSLGRRWRMLVREVDGVLQAHSVLSHEDYSSRWGKPR
ncbi:MAG TPA: hypothetical protein VMX11_00710 [Actinomycetes bacterium]|nr:hypothetical protein [Actinomycetes bacterium]